MTAHLIINHWLVRWFNSILHLFTHHPTTSCGWMHRLRGLFFHFRIILRRRRKSSICPSVYSFCPNTSRPLWTFISMPANNLVWEELWAGQKAGCLVRPQHGLRLGPVLGGPRRSCALRHGRVPLSAWSAASGQYSLDVKQCNKFPYDWICGIYISQYFWKLQWHSKWNRKWLGLVFIIDIT